MRRRMRSEELFTLFQSGYPEGMRTDEMREFVLAGLDEDERRLAAGELPWLDEAERRGRLRILRSDDGQGLLLTDGPLQVTEERAPVPFAEKAPLLRAEVEGGADEETLRLLASAYETRAGWQEEWRV